MAVEGKSIVKNSFGVMVATLCSRILGLLRVRLEATVLGGGAVASTWMLLFMIPNLARRVLGEGALGTALLPLIADTEAHEGIAAVRKKLAVIFAALGMILILVVLIVCGISWLLVANADGFAAGICRERYIYDMLKLLPLIMPFCFFICMIGAITAVLNYAKIFQAPAWVSLLLNVFLLGGFGAAWYLKMVPEQFLPMLSVLVVAAGILQFAFVLFLLYKNGLFPECKWSSFIGCKNTLGELLKLATPGILSYSTLQLSFFIDRSLAASLGPQAVPALSFADRLIDLPIGLFAVSLGGVLMASMTRAAAEGKNNEIAETLAFSLRLVWFVCVPLAVMMIFFNEPMLRLLCLGGRYSLSDLEAATMVVVFYGTGIPLFCSLKVIYPAFYARKKMWIPLKISLVAFVVNLVCNLILMRFLQQSGLALATVISSLINNSLLLWHLHREGFDLQVPSVASALCRIIMVAVIASGSLYFVYLKFLRAWGQQGYLNEFCVLATIGICFMLLYLGLAYICKLHECQAVVQQIRKRLKR